MFGKYPKAMYWVKWQLGTPVISPIIAYLVQNFNMSFWLSIALANTVGAIIFYRVDKAIFGKGD